MSSQPSRARHAAEEVHWARSDAWVLAALRVSGTPDQPATLFDLIAACDAVNHLIASRNEIEHAVALLAGVGLVVVDDRGFAVTPQGRALVAEAGKAALQQGKAGSRGRAGAEARIEALLALLETMPPRAVPWSLDPRSYESACLQYQHTRWTEYRRPGRVR